MMWQPIESAPKDGTSVLAYDPELIDLGRETFPGSMRYTTGGKMIPRGVYISNWREADGLNRAGWSDGCLFGNPSHWMPLPLRPEST